MAEKARYPQIPSTVWWGVRSILQKTPNIKIDERLLAVQLGVQEAASRQYIAELQTVGLLTDEGKATPIAQKWRLDETYAAAVRELVAAAYPEGLLHVAPPGEADRHKVVSWFLHEGLGQGSAGNKAATYLLVSSLSPNEAAPRAGARSAKESGASTLPSKSAGGQKPKGATRKEGAHNPASGGEQRSDRQRSQLLESFPLNINVQIHISADAGAEQIESIFAAMRRYLYDGSNS